jgi:hypothetical protein
MNVFNLLNQKIANNSLLIQGETRISTIGVVDMRHEISISLLRK